MSSPSEARPRLVGGEMPGWSDVEQARRAPAGGPVLAYLASALSPAGRTLVAGPHDTALLTALPATGLTCLLRSLPDAAVLAGHGFDVLCGTLPKLDPDVRYDTVVALDGFDRLCSVEGPQLDWSQTLHALRALVRPGGTLVFAVENELGLHRLVDRSAGHPDAWATVGELDRARPGNPDRLLSRLAADGLTVSWLGAAWPTPDQPTLVATPAVFADPDAPLGALQASVAAAAGVGYRGRAVLSDPRRLAAAAVRAGLGAPFAATWLVVGHRAPGPATPAGLPPVLMGLGPAGPVLRVCREPDGRWSRTPVTAPDDGGRPGGITRDVGRLTGPLPVGRLLEELLLTACLHHDLAAARRLLTGYVDWLGTADGGHAFATFDNVLVDAGRFDLLDPSRLIDRSVPVDVAALHAVRRFAATVVTGGHPHPWPGTADVDALTAVLAAAAGIPAGQDGLAAAIDLELDVRCGEQPGTDRTALLDEVRRPGRAPSMITPASWRDLEDLIQRLDADLADARARAQWSDRELDRRERQLRRARLQIAAFDAKPLHRLARTVIRAGRRAGAVVKRAIRSSTHH